jgi:hypothetical protein
MSRKQIETICAQHNMIECDAHKWAIDHDLFATSFAFAHDKQYDDDVVVYVHKNYAICDIDHATTGYAYDVAIDALSKTLRDAIAKNYNAQR